jgi:hypothetical protein
MINLKCLLIIILLAVSLSSPFLQPVRADNPSTLDVNIDTMVWSLNPTTSYNDTSETGWLFIGRVISGGYAHSYLLFDLSSITLPITSATLRIDVAGMVGSPAASVYSITGTWDGSVTWNTRPTYGSQYVYSAVPGGLTWLSMDVTSLVAEWLNGTLPNNGLVIKNETISDPNQIAFNSLEYGGSDVAYLEFEYVVVSERIPLVLFSGIFVSLLITITLKKK